MMLREWLGRFASWRRREEMSQELTDEIDAHIALLARDYAHHGMPPADALLAARRQVGNVGRLREQSRDAWGFPAIDALMQDVRYALRGLRRSPGFTATVVLTLGLGIGANTAMFAVIDRLMFRPFPMLHDPATAHRVYLETTYRGTTNANPTFPYLRYVDLSRATRTIADMAAESEWRFAVGSGEATTVRKVVGVTPSFFAFFDAPPALGRYMLASEDSGTGQPVAVLSHAIWATEFRAANVLGQLLKIGTVDYTIVGVAPAGFVGTTDGAVPDIFVPLASVPANVSAWSEGSFRRDYSWDWVQVLVRRRPGVSVREVSAELTAAYVRSRAAQRTIQPRTLPDSLVHPLAIAGPVKLWAGPDAGREAKVMLWVSGVAVIVLLIACANVANMMIARVIRRRREITVRLALGVGRGRLTRQFLAEAGVLAGLGAIAGVGTAQWAGVAIRNMLLPQGSSFNLAADWRTLGMAAVCAVAATLATTIGPSLTALKTDISASLKSGARGGTMERSRLSATLLVVQAALSVVLLIGAGLFVRSFSNARALRLGYDAQPVIEVTPDFRGYSMDTVQSVAARRALLASAQSLPGVVTATRVNSRLFATNTARLEVPGIDSVESLGRFNFQIATPEYFRVMQTRILRGRGFTAADRAGAPRVTVVSEAMARALWPSRDALGQCIRVGLGASPLLAGAPCTSVIGIAENTAQQNLTDDPRFMYYLPADQVAPSVSTLYIRLATPDARGEVERIRRALTRTMPGNGFVVVRPLQEVVDDQRRSWRLGATLFAAFGGLALVVAMVGLYGVVSYSVEQRRHEIGVRMALGATRRRVVRLVVAQSLRATGAAVAIGTAIAIAAAPRTQPLLFAESARDPLVYLAVATAMLAAAIAASAGPAARAARMDPNAAFRAD
jgi:predicted permease